jgi:hypothetical protein
MAALMVPEMLTGSPLYLVSDSRLMTVGRFSRYQIQLSAALTEIDTFAAVAEGGADAKPMSGKLATNVTTPSTGRKRMRHTL